MSQSTHTIWGRLEGGPHDGNTIRLEGDILPSVLGYGFIDDPEEGNMAFYQIANSDEKNDHPIYHYSGSCKVNLLPTFLWWDPPPHPDEI